MITTVIIETKGRPSWRTPNETPIIRTGYTQIEGTITGSHTVMGALAQVLILTVDAGDQIVTVSIHGANAHTADGTVRGLPSTGQQVCILATPAKRDADYSCTGNSHLICL